MRTRDFVFVILAGVLWGGGGVVGVLMVRHTGMEPLSVAMWRMLIAGVAMLGFLAVVGRLHLGSFTRPMWVRSLATGALTAAFEGLLFTALSLASVGLTTLIAIGSAPVFVALYDWLVRGEKPRARTLLALIIALAGLVLLLSGSLEIGRNGLVGALLAVGCGASFAAITVINRVPVPGLAPVPLTGVAFAAGGLMLVPLALIQGIGAPSDAYGWGLALFLGIAITALAYVFYLNGLRTVPPFVATIVVLLEPLIAAVLGVIILSEQLGWTAIVGGIVLGGAVILLRPQRDEPESIH
jgi:DME family drug/metabolite transporter